MAKTALQVTEVEYKADPANVQRIEVPIPGVAQPLVSYVQVQFVDDLTGKPAEGIETVQLLVPVEAEREVTELDAEGDTVLNEDGSAKITTEKYTDFEARELDLSPASLKKLQTALKPFYEKSRERVVSVPRTAVAKKTASGPNPELTEWNRRVRVWLNESPNTPVKKTEEVPDRGRIKSAWEEAYVAANPSDAKPE